MINTKKPNQHALLQTEPDKHRGQSERGIKYHQKIFVLIFFAATSALFSLGTVSNHNVCFIDNFN